MTYLLCWRNRINPAHVSRLPLHATDIADAVRLARSYVPLGKARLFWIETWGEPATRGTA